MSMKIEVNVDRDLRDLPKSEDPAKNKSPISDEFVFGENKRFGKLIAPANFPTRNFGSVACPKGAWVWLDKKGNLVMTSRTADDQRFGDVLCDKDEGVVFKKRCTKVGDLRGCQLVETTTVNGVELPAGVEFEHFKKGVLVVTFTQEQQDFQGDKYPAGSELAFIAGKKFKLQLEAPCTLQGKTWSDDEPVFYHKNGMIKSGMTVDGAMLEFDEDGKLISTETPSSNQ